MNWMAWTWPTGLFFISVGVMLMSMIVIEIKWPGIDRRGFLPMITSRGDRLFISLLSAAYIHLVWLAMTTLPLVFASVLATAAAIVVMKWG